MVTNLGIGTIKVTKMNINTNIVTKINIGTIKIAKLVIIMDINTITKLGISTKIVSN